MFDRYHLDSAGNVRERPSELISVYESVVDAVIVHYRPSWDFWARPALNNVLPPVSTTAGALPTTVAAPPVAPATSGPSSGPPALVTCGFNMSVLPECSGTVPMSVADAWSNEEGDDGGDDEADDDGDSPPPLKRLRSARSSFTIIRRDPTSLSAHTPMPEAISRSFYERLRDSGRLPSWNAAGSAQDIWIGRPKVRCSLPGFPLLTFVFAVHVL
jgi:hypothetical protein